MHIHLMVHDVDVRVRVIVVARMAWYACVQCIVPHVRFRTCEACVVLEDFICVGDTCDVYFGDTARAGEFDIAVLNTYVCVDDAR